MRCRTLAVLLVAALAASPSRPQATSDPDLEKGVRQAQEGDFEAAITTLEPVARRLEAQGSRAPALGRAHLYLGVAELGLGQEAAARRRFQEALRAHPGLRVTSEEFPPRIVEMFQSVRREQAPPPTTLAGRQEGRGRGQGAAHRGWGRGGGGGGAGRRRWW